MMIKCQLIGLLSRRQIQEQRKITYREVARATGLQASTVTRMANNQVTRFDADTLSALCAYFECELGELLVYEKDEQEPSH